MHGYQQYHLFYGLVCGKVEIACEVISTAINTILPSKYSKCVLVKRLTTSLPFHFHPPNPLSKDPEKQDRPWSCYRRKCRQRISSRPRWTGRVWRRPAGGAAERAGSWKLLGPRALKQGVGSSVRPLRPSSLTPPTPWSLLD